MYVALISESVNKFFGIIWFFRSNCKKTNLLCTPSAKYLGKRIFKIPLGTECRYQNTAMLSNLFRIIKKCTLYLQEFNIYHSRCNKYFYLIKCVYLLFVFT